MEEKQHYVVPQQAGQHSDHREIYTNSSKIGTTPWDMRIVFGHVIDLPQMGQQKLEDLVTIVMSPQHAKVLLGAWTKAIEAYEATFGTIPDLTEAAKKIVSQKLS